MKKLYTIEKQREFNIEKKQIEKLAYELIELARDTIIVRFRFFDVALAKIKLVSKTGLGGFATDGECIYFDSAFLLKRYLTDSGIAVRGILHALLHLIFLHQFNYDKLDEECWDLATDIAVENIILELDFKSASLERDSREQVELDILKRRLPVLTADKIYRKFKDTPLTEETKIKYRELFFCDIHGGWKISEESEFVINEEQWKKISRRVKSDIDNFSKGGQLSESLYKNLNKSLQDKYDYRQLLERFVISGEELGVSEDEFDYVYYTYGLKNYGNMPLIEPLEYKEVKKVKELVIAIDTSASCNGEKINRFITKTFNILKSTENFFNSINLHVVQCDAQVQLDTKIRSELEFHEFVKRGELKGYGATDFRPVFRYVDELIKKGQFENLKGLIYFTDGYGIYPEKMPDYDVVFAFVDEDEALHNVPGWAIKIIMEDELDEY